jgi:hypothetical protein
MNACSGGRVCQSETTGRIPVKFDIGFNTLSCVKKLILVRVSPVTPILHEAQIKH